MTNDESFDLLYAKMIKLTRYSDEMLLLFLYAGLKSVNVFFFVSNSLNTKIFTLTAKSLVGGRLLVSLAKC